jgi:hypothetical protein
MTAMSGKGIARQALQPIQYHQPRIHWQKSDELFTRNEPQLASARSPESWQTVESNLLGTRGIVGIVDIQRNSHVSSGINEALARAEWMLNLEDDWDGEGSVGFSKITFNRAADFLRRYATGAWKRAGTIIPVPEILPGPDGSIDILWKTEGYELLVNIPAENKLASFYGDDLRDANIKGTFDASVENLGLLEWFETYW